jgi:flagellar motor switch/type III secretory pathway protein FliN
MTTTSQLKTTELQMLAGDSSASPALEQAMEEHPAWPMISRLPVTLAVSVPMKRMRVRDLLGLACGQTLESSWAATEDVPLKVGELQLSWGEFETVEQRMALRLTRLA